MNANNDNDSEKAQLPFKFALFGARIISEFTQIKKSSPIFQKNLIKMKFSLFAIAAVIASAEAISKPSLSVSHSLSPC